MGDTRYLAEFPKGAEPIIRQRSRIANQAQTSCNSRQILRSQGGLTKEKWQAVKKLEGVTGVCKQRCQVAAGDSPGKTCRILWGEGARCTPNSLDVFQPLETEHVREISYI